MTAELYFRLSCTGPTYLKTEVFASSQDQWNSWMLFCWEQITVRVSQPNPSKSSREAAGITSSHVLYIKANHTLIRGTGDCTLVQVGGHYQLTWERAAAKRSLKSGATNAIQHRQMPHALLQAPTLRIYSAFHYHKCCNSDWVHMSSPTHVTYPKYKSSEAKLLIKGYDLSFSNFDSDCQNTAQRWLIATNVGTLIILKKVFATFPVNILSLHDSEFYKSCSKQDWQSFNMLKGHLYFLFEPTCSSFAIFFQYFLFKENPLPETKQESNGHGTKWNGLALLLATKPVWVLKTSYLYVRKDFLFVLRKYCTGIQCILVIDTPHFLQLPIRAWVRAHPLEHGEPTSGLSTKKSDSFSSSQLPVGRQLEVGLQEFFPHPYWSF